MNIEKGIEHIKLKGDEMLSAVPTWKGILSLLEAMKDDGKEIPSVKRGQICDVDRNLRCVQE